MDHFDAWSLPSGGAFFLWHGSPQSKFSKTDLSLDNISLSIPLKFDSLNVVVSWGVAGYDFVSCGIKINQDIRDGAY